MLMCTVIQDKQGNMNDGPGVNLLANFHKKRVSSSGLFIYVTFSEHLLRVVMSPVDLNSEINSSIQALMENCVIKCIL